MQRLLWLITLAILALLAIPACQGQVPDRTTARIQKEVLHELTMLPFLTVFDNLAFKVEGDKVVLLGQVVNPVNKTDAGKAVKGIEGVEQVDNQIEVLPVSPMDSRLRRALYRAIYGFAPLQKYDMGVIKPIRIIVKNRESSGHDAGYLFFISTIGSSAGTLLTSVFLVLYLEVNTILLVAISISLMLGAAGAALNLGKE